MMPDEVRVGTVIPGLLLPEPIEVLANESKPAGRRRPHYWL